MTTSTKFEPIKHWTVMVYLAGDNNLESFGLKDLLEMKVAGSDANLNIIAQFDKMSDSITRRYYLKNTSLLSEDCVDELNETNTGHPDTLTNFITWAIENYPAEHYMLVLWNHGTGWKEDNIYQIAKTKGVGDKLTKGQFRGISKGKISRALFSTTLMAIIAEVCEFDRAICFDDTSADFLDNLELKRVLNRITEQLGRKIDILGFDACLMSMLEVAYQIRSNCSCMVGSQEIEPGDGWPYDRILGELKKHPTMSPQAFTSLIVEQYATFYRSEHPNLAVTQAALNLEYIEPLAQAVHELGIALRELLSDRHILGSIYIALRLAQAFSDRDYIDLRHFCQLLGREVNHPRIKAAARRIDELLDAETSSSLVIAEAHNGKNVTNANGIAIYLPTRTLSPFYTHLEFSQNHQWDNFLNALLSPSSQV